MPGNKNILFCTDFSEHANTAFIHALYQAQKYDAKLHIFTVLLPDDPCGRPDKDDSAPPEHLNSAVESKEDLGQQKIGAMKLKYLDALNGAIRDYDFIVKVGSPDLEIVQYARENNIDMIILGALGIPENERVTRVRTAANVSKFAPCQVVVIQKSVQQDFGI